MSDTLVYTICDEKYAKFVPLFIYSNLFYDNVDIEVGIYTSKQNLDYIDESVKMCKLLFPDREICIRYLHPNDCVKYKFTNLLFVNSLRFVIEPLTKRDFVYISDVDIICCTENFTSFLKQDMNENNRQYSNICRDKNAKHKHLSGLHFTKWDAYYPLDFKKIKFSDYGDECLLYDIVRMRNEIDYCTKYRPVFGPHVSPSRSPKKVGSIPGWGYEPFKKNFRTLIEDETFLQLSSVITNDTKRIINILNNLYEAVK